MPKNYHNIKETILHLTRSGANTRDMYDYIHMLSAFYFLPMVYRV